MSEANFKQRNLRFVGAMNKVNFISKLIYLEGFEDKNFKY